MKNWKIKCILFISVCYFDACTYINRRFYTDPTIYFAKARNSDPYDALIVPGFPHVKDSMTRVVQHRVMWACYLYKRGMVQNIIFSGSSVYTPYREAEIMAMYAIQLGVPAEHVYTEIKAEHSTENLYYSYHIAKKNGWNRVAVATEASQSSFIYSINNDRFKIPVDFIPIVPDTLITLPYIEPDINQESAYDPDFVSIIEREGLWKRFRGTNGRVVKKLMREE